MATHNKSGLQKVKEVWQTCNLSEESGPHNFLSKTLLLIRACVFPMTINSILIAGLIVATASNPNWWLYALSGIGMIIAHSANNLMNDYYDMQGGVDEEGYIRALYAPHPVLSGMLTKKQLFQLVVFVNSIDLAIMIYLIYVRGWTIAAFALAGFFISLFYVAPPIKLKKMGLGELGVGIVWGPLMIAGIYYAAVGSLTPAVWWLSIPNGIVVTTVLLGKHVDKLEIDRKKNINTLPVKLGAKASLNIIKIMMVSFYLLIIALYLLKFVGIYILITLLGIKRLITVWPVFNKPPPEEPPENYPVWPLWYVSWAFNHTVFAGGLFVIGLLLNIFLPPFFIT